MITVYGEGRGLRVVWLLEEMGLPYRLHQIDLLADISHETEFLEINPAGFIPAIEDGETRMVESVAIMEVLLARHGTSPLAPVPGAAEFTLYQQFLHMGEAGLMAASYFLSNALRLADPAQRDNPTARHCRAQFFSRLGLVTRQLALTEWIAGESFTAADVSVAYALDHGRRASSLDLGPVAGDYVARATARPAYRRALDSCTATRDWHAAADAESA